MIKRIRLGEVNLNTDKPQREVSLERLVYELNCSARDSFDVQIVSKYGRDIEIDRDSLMKMDVVEYATQTTYYVWRKYYIDMGDECLVFVRRRGDKLSQM